MCVITVCLWLVEPLQSQKQLNTEEAVSQMTGWLSEQIRGSEAVLMLLPLTRLRLQLYWVWVLRRVPLRESAGLHCNHSLQWHNSQSEESTEEKSHHWNKLVLLFYNSEVTSRRRTSRWNIYSCGDGSLGENKPTNPKTRKQFEMDCMLDVVSIKRAGWMKGFSFTMNLGPVNLCFFSSSSASNVSSNLPSSAFLWLWVIFRTFLLFRIKSANLCF